MPVEACLHDKSEGSPRDVTPSTTHTHTKAAHAINHTHTHESSPRDVTASTRLPLPLCTNSAAS